MPSEEIGQHLLPKTEMDPDRRGSEPYVDQSFLLESPSYVVDIMNKLNSFRSEGCLTDTILCVGHEEFPCHRNVLAVSSPYFQAMFSSDLRECREGRISFNEVSPWTMRRLIDYAYTGCIEITVDNAQDLLAAASLFQYPAIEDACCSFLARHLHGSNCLGIEDFAHLHSCEKLEADAHRYVLENFSVVVEYEEFIELSLARLITYLSSDLIDVHKEETVFEAAMRWISHNPETRVSNVCSVMEHIRLATIDVQYLDEEISKHEYIKNCKICAELLGDAKRYHETKTEQHGQRRRSMQTDTYNPRPSTVAKEVLVLLGGLNNVNYIMQSVEMYDPHKDKSCALPDMPLPTSWFSVSALENNIYVSGGILDGHIIANVWKFESVKRRWEEVPCMLSPRARHASAVWDGKLYVVGGINLVAESKIVLVEGIECFDVATEQWRIVGQSPFPRKQSHVVPYEQTLVELGGTQGGAQTQTMESYICTNTSVTYSGEQFILPECIQFSQIVVLNGIFYIIWEDSKKMISLNPAKRTFRRLSDLHYTHIHCGATVLDDKIYVAGGLIDSKPSRIIECYDIVMDTWTIVKSMRQARACHGAITIQMS